MKGLVNAAIVGAAGRMGLEVTRAAQGREDVRIRAAVEQSGSPHKGRDLGELAGIGFLDVSIDDDLASALETVAVAIDFSSAAATETVARAAAATGTALVCGTTGIDDAALAAFETAAEKIPVLHAPNLSPGVAVTAALVERAVSALGPEYDVEIVEMHHRNKADAPSGTALYLAQAAMQGAGTPAASTLRLGRGKDAGLRSKSEIGVHAVRGGSVFGDHTVILAGAHDRIEITHRAGSRTLFAAGALRAAVFLADRSPGRYKMTDVLSAKE
ncbi:MAG: 4-hydroxy-tetrahydrodipicolinate reductase [Myxococcota bacterium]|nr:4-hydroxy-tetrahydrodipicolinate reductase [Myxococcota bacterium]